MQFLRLEGISEKSEPKEVIQGEELCAGVAPPRKRGLGAGSMEDRAHGSRARMCTSPRSWWGLLMILCKE